MQQVLTLWGITALILRVGFGSVIAIEPDRLQTTLLCMIIRNIILSDRWMS